MTAIAAGSLSVKEGFRRLPGQREGKLIRCLEDLYPVCHGWWVIISCGRTYRAVHHDLMHSVSAGSGRLRR